MTKEQKEKEKTKSEKIKEHKKEKPRHLIQRDLLLMKKNGC